MAVARNTRGDGCRRCRGGRSGPASLARTRQGRGTGISTVKAPTHRVSAAIGGIAGLASGLLGVGGGFLMVPLQVMWSRTSQHRASGTSLAAILPVASVGAVVYYFGKGKPQVDLVVALFLVMGSVIGAFAGAHASRRVPEHALKMLVAVLLFAVGLKEMHDALLGATAALTGNVGGGLELAQYLLVTAAGFVIGVLIGLTGVGGGVFLVPTMVVGFGLAQRVAQGTSIGRLDRSRRHPRIPGGSCARSLAA